MADGSIQSGLCLGHFSGDTSKPGYQLMRKLADTLNAPVHASVWKLPIKGGWDLGPTISKLTVGPGGGWVYRERGQPTRFGDP
jgi:hypothetical protein